MKRSSKITLVLVASVSAVALGGCEPAAQPAPDLEVTSSVYSNVQECTDTKAKAATPAGQAPTAAVIALAKDACVTAETKAKAEFANTAPTYSNRAACEEQYGPAACAPRSNYSGNSNDNSIFMPLMVGYMLGNMNNSTPLYYGAGSWRDHDRDRPIYAGGYNSRPVGYQSPKAYQATPSRSAAGSSFKSDLKTSTSMTPPSSLRGGFGSGGFKAAPGAVHAAVPASSVAARTSSFKASGGYSSGGYKSSSSVSSRGGFGGTSHGFSSGG
jgi:uncharacterized protein YgiB involved in biofilm formation